jgi:acyl-CoA hydrolase
MLRDLAPRLEGQQLDHTQITEAIPTGATVFLEQGAAEPLTLHRALLAAPPRSELRVLAAPVTGFNSCDFTADNVVTQLSPLVFVGTPALAEKINSGRVDYLPLHWSDVVRAFRGRFKPDVALLQVSPPDNDGYCNLGSNAAFELEVAQLSNVVIAEVNHNVPVVAGDTRLHQSHIDYFIESEAPLRAVPTIPPGPVERQIARHVVDLIPSESTLQVGTGKVPDAVMDELLRSGRAVKFQSGILTDAMMRMADAAPSRADPIIAGMLLGSEELYRAAHRNPRISLRNTDYTHSQNVLGGLDKFVSINSAIEVDLLGQVNAESVAGRQVAGVGGQVDFFRGARASEGGVSIVALPSSSKSGSRVVSTLAPGTPVSTSRVDVDVVVTEYGVAELANRTVAERVDALIAIAHPAHRDGLRAAAAKGA